LTHSIRSLDVKFEIEMLQWTSYKKK
jgi:hypothetical protein